MPRAPWWLLVVGTLAGALPLAAQSEGYRFTIDQAGDSTVTFSTQGQGWVHPGLRGIAVDPRRHDALVARLEVLSVAGGQAVALITGQTTRLSPEHAVVLTRPPAPFFRQAVFWIGAAAGAAVGAIVVAASHH